MKVDYAPCANEESCSYSMKISLMVHVFHVLLVAVSSLIDGLKIVVPPSQHQEEGKGKAVSVEELRR